MTDETRHEEFEVGALVVAEGQDGFWTIAEHKAGWFTLTNNEGEEHKARAKALELVPDVEDEEDEEGGRTMAKTLAEHKPRYFECTTYSGSKSLNNGDRIAKLLEGLEPGTVALLADRVKEEPDGFHATKYEHLNPGQVRMNSGNRIRAHAKQGGAEFAEVMDHAAKLGIGEDADEAA